MVSAAMEATGCAKPSSASGNARPRRGGGAGRGGGGGGNGRGSGRRGGVGAHANVPAAGGGGGDAVSAALDAPSGDGGGGRGLHLLAHFSYHETNASRAHDAAQQEACVRYVETLLAEAETYEAFDRVDVTLDLNSGNPYAARLRS